MTKSTTCPSIHKELDGRNMFWKSIFSLTIIGALEAAEAEELVEVDEVELAELVLVDPRAIETLSNAKDLERKENSAKNR